MHRLNGLDKWNFVMKVQNYKTELVRDTVAKRGLHRWDGPDKYNFVMKVPDYRIYKIDGIKQLELVRDTLARRGLKDPWLRNEVWRYPDWYEHPHRTIFKIMTIGLIPAFLLIVVTIIGQEYYWKKVGRPKHIHTLFDFLYHYHVPADTRRIE